MDAKGNLDVSYHLKSKISNSDYTTTVPEVWNVKDYINSMPPDDRIDAKVALLLRNQGDTRTLHSGPAKTNTHENRLVGEQTRRIITNPDGEKNTTGVTAGPAEMLETNNNYKNTSMYSDLYELASPITKLAAQILPNLPPQPRLSDQRTLSDMLGSGVWETFKTTIDVISDKTPGTLKILVLGIALMIFLR